MSNVKIFRFKPFHLGFNTVSLEVVHTSVKHEQRRTGARLRAKLGSFGTSTCLLN